MNLKTRLRSTAMRMFSSPKYLEKQRKKARSLRQKRSEAPTVHYFHQVDDPYGHLAVQKLEALQNRYSLTFEPHLVSKPGAAYLGSATHFDQWALNDARSVARDYSTQFDPSITSPTPEAVALANQALAAHINDEGFASAALSIGNAFWQGETSKTTTDPHVASQTATQALAAGNALRHTLGHYQGAMFYFEGEWFWGIDRIRLLEARLCDEGFSKDSNSICVPEPTPTDTTKLDASEITLEYFPSLRSPYTAVGHQRVLELIERSGVSVKVRPVMPMMMRGIPAPREKQRYIITDASREGIAHGAPFGRLVDPFGEPVKRAFALFPGASQLGHGMDFVSAYLAAAWFDGTDITTDKGLKKVVQDAGMEWHALQQANQNTHWEAVLDENLQVMLDANLWGVPSFRVTGGNSELPYACWGQDRIWRVENEIAQRAS